MIILANGIVKFMKVLIFSCLIVFTISSKTFAQADGNWSAGVGTTSTIVGYTFNIYINRRLGERWELGAMPFALFTFIPDYNYTMIGLNIKARLYLSNWKKVRPYAYGYSGLGAIYSNFDNRPNSTSDVITFSNTSFGVGIQVPIGKKGWSLDGNFGYQGYFAITEEFYLHNTVFSFSVYKRFRKKIK